MCTSHWLFLGPFIYWIELQKYYISEYVCKTCLKELAINMGKPLKKYCSLIFLPYFKNKYFLEHLTMATSGNVKKYAVLHNT